MSVFEVFWVFLRLGLTSFGGPVAHIGYFRDEFVHRRQWFTEAAYADLVALCQFLPGPASSQVGIGIGLSRAGLAGAVAAWVGFTLPSALALGLFGFGVAIAGEVEDGWLRGLKAVAVAVVAQALWGMAKSLCPDRTRAAMAVAAAVLVLMVPTSLGQITAIVAAGALGWLFVKSEDTGDHHPLAAAVGKPLAVAALALFFAMLFGLAPLAAELSSPLLARIDGFYRAGSLVFGGGHVVLPLLQATVVEPGWVGEGTFLAGYGAAQAVPGPLFTFAAYLGAVMESPLGPGASALVCILAIFAPSFLLVVGALPFWDGLRGMASMRGAMAGVNAAVVGLLAAAFYDPVWTSGVKNAGDFALVLAAGVLLVSWKLPPWLVVALAAGAGYGIGLI
jgi:chromate transporter